jgi:hypothetical protein
VEAQVTDLTVGGSQGLTFGQARFAYRPAASASGQASAGFEMVVDSTDAGYVVTTTTVVPMAKSP